MAEASPRPGIPDGVTRRDVLRGASAGLAVSLTSPWLSGCAQPAEETAAPPAAPTLTPADMPGKWSVEEIHRRWLVTRERMKEERLDCLLVPQHNPGGMVVERIDGDMDVDWLTGNTLPFKFVVLPLEGTVTAISDGKIRNTPEEIWTKERGIEVRIGGPWSKAIIEVLREKGMERARIGVGNLVDAPRQPEGEISYTTYDRVIKALPRVTWVSAADLLLQVKLARSAEEIAAYEKSVAVGELGLEAVKQTARPGVPQRVVWLAMFDAMVNASGERPFRLSVTANGDPANRSCNRPVEDVIPAGRTISQECTGSVLGTGTQVNQSMLVGGPAPADWESTYQYCLETWQQIVDAIAPGKTVGEVSEIYAKRREARGMSGSGVVFHSAELRVGTGSEVVLQPGMVWDIKPTIEMEDGQTIQIGESIVVTDSGARRLGTRDMSAVTLGA